MRFSASALAHSDLVYKPRACWSNTADKGYKFEHSQTPEVRFANAVDSAMPVLLNLANHGGSWLENGVGYERVVGRIGPQIK